MWVCQDQIFTFLSSFPCLIDQSVKATGRAVHLTGFHLCTSMDLFMSMSQVFEVIRHKNSEFKQRTQMKTHVNDAAKNLVS